MPIQILSADTGARDERRGRRRLHGVTLLELLIALLIVAILAAIALPSYRQYVVRTRLKSGQADLVSLGVNMENYYQQQLGYPAVTSGTTQLESVFAGWSPAQASDFTYAISAVDNSASPATYTLRAAGVTGSIVAGYTLTLTSTNVRTQLSPSGVSSTW